MLKGWWFTSMSDCNNVCNDVFYPFLIVVTIIARPIPPHPVPSYPIPSHLSSLFYPSTCIRPHISNPFHPLLHLTLPTSVSLFPFLFFLSFLHLLLPLLPPPPSLSLKTLSGTSSYQYLWRTTLSPSQSHLWGTLAIKVIKRYVHAHTHTREHRRKLLISWFLFWWFICVNYSFLSLATCLSIAIAQWIAVVNLRVFIISF